MESKILRGRGGWSERYGLLLNKGWVRRRKGQGSRETGGRGCLQDKGAEEKPGELSGKDGLHPPPCISVHRDPAQAKAALTGTPLS